MEQKQYGRHSVHYRLGTIEIHTENTAKPIGREAQAVVQCLKSQAKVEHALDYGCGKLRYSKHLADLAEHVTLVDSAEQIDRVQRIGGSRTSVREFARTSWPKSRVLTPDDLLQDSTCYGFVFCANVLSAIPSRMVQMQIVESVASKLTDSGRSLWVTQYVNSYYTHAAQRPTAIPYLDGLLMHGRKGWSYYGLIPLQTLTSLLESGGHEVLEAWVCGQSALALTRRTTRP